MFDDPCSTAAELRDTDVTRYIADVEYDFGSGWTDKSVTALANTHLTIEAPLGSTFNRMDTRDVTDFSQDVRVTYDQEGVPLSGVFGVFAGQFTRDISSDISTDTILGSSIPVFSVFDTSSLPIQELTGDVQTTSLAAHTELQYRFSIG